MLTRYPILKEFEEGRGKQIAPTKVRIALRLDEDIVTSFKATGKGWQSKMNEALRRVTPTLQTATP